MPLSAEALAALRAPSSSRERYPDWVVTRTERLAPSRRCKPEALDEDGFREYSFLPCVNGCGVDVKICSDYLKQHKNQAVTDHLSVCMAVVEEDRPRKVPRGGVAVSALTDPSKTALGRDSARPEDSKVITDAEIAMVLDRSEEGRKRQGKGFMTMERHTNAFDAAHRA